MIGSEFKEGVPIIDTVVHFLIKVDDVISSSFHTWGCLGGVILSSDNLFGDVSQHTDNVPGNLFAQH